MSQKFDDDLTFINTDEFAEITRRTPNAIRKLRMDDEGPPYIKLGPSRQARCLYKLSDVRKWLADQLVDPAAHAGDTA